MTVSPERVVRAIAAVGLTTSLMELPSAPLDPATWTYVTSLVRSHRVEGHLVDAVERGALPADEEQAAEAADLHLAAMVRCVRLERALVGVLDSLAARGIDHRVLKGSAWAHVDYPDPSLRSYGDVDVLIRPGSFDEALRCLESMGHHRRYPQPRPGFDRRFTKSVTMVHPEGIEIDVHRTVAEGGFGARVELEVLWESSASFVVGGVEALALGPDERLLHACYHAALGDRTPRLSALRDIATMLETGRFDPDRVDELAKRWVGRAVLARAVELTTTSFDLRATPFITRATSREASRRERRELAAHVAPESSYAARAWTTLRSLRGVRERVAYAWALGFPAEGYVRDRYRTRSERLRGASRALRQLAARSRRSG
jgi:hypothetical protein